MQSLDYLSLLSCVGWLLCILVKHTPILSTSICAECRLEAPFDREKQLDKKKQTQDESIFISFGFFGVPFVHASASRFTTFA